LSVRRTAAASLSHWNRGSDRPFSKGTTSTREVGAGRDEAVCAATGVAVSVSRPASVVTAQRTCSRDLVIFN
jgi:hypothetical protein